MLRFIFLPKKDSVQTARKYVQNFNNLINDERKLEADRVSGREHYGNLLNGRNKWIFLKKSTSRSKSETAHIN